MDTPREEQEEDDEEEIDTDLKRLWSLYFPFDDIKSGDSALWVMATQHFRSFFDPNQGGQGHCLISTTDLQVATEVVLDYQRLLILLTPELHGLSQVLKTNASTTLACLGLAICSLRDLTNCQAAANLNKINVRIANYSPLTQLSQLNSSHLGQFVSLHGTVTSVGPVIPLIKTLVFLCKKCSEQILCQVPDGKYQPPTVCDAMGCMSKSFKIQKTKTKCVDLQKVRTYY
tara:strand:+ start:381 stop:1070 length:690 start_codon:yes stop_codon:yes gene_type:complete